MLNFGTTLLFFAVTTATALITTPWLIAWLGDAPYGAFRVIYGWYGYLTLLELGLGGAIGPLVVRDLALESDDRRPLECTLSAGVRAYAKVTVVTVIVGLAATPWIDRTVRDLAASDIGDLRTAWVLMVLGFLPLCLLPFRSLQDADQRGYRINLIQIVQSLTITAVSLYLAAQNWGIVGQAVGLTIGAWLYPIALTFDVLRTRPGLFRSVLRSTPGPETRRALRNLSGSTLLFNLTSRISLMTDDIVVGKLLGRESVTSLFLSQRLAVLAQSQIQAVGSATWAALAQLHVHGEHDAFRKRLVELTRLVSVLAVSTLVPIVAFNRAFLGVWMKAKFQPCPALDWVILVAAINAWLMGLISLWGWCISGTGQMGLLRRPAVASAILNLGLSLALCHALGVIGVLLGTTTALMAVNLWYLPMLLRRSFGVSIRSLAVASIGPVVVALPAAFACNWFARNQGAIGWIGLILEMSVGLGVTLALNLLLLFKAEDRRRWRARIAGLRRTKGTPVTT
jgi:O-antigen/teichoic acid export membrane protein